VVGLEACSTLPALIKRTCEQDKRAHTQLDHCVVAVLQSHNPPPLHHSACMGMVRRKFAGVDYRFWCGYGTRLPVSHAHGWVTKGLRRLMMQPTSSST